MNFFFFIFFLDKWKRPLYFRQIITVEGRVTRRKREREKEKDINGTSNVIKCSMIMSSLTKSNVIIKSLMIMTNINQ